MKYLQTYKTFESSTLSALGISKEIMQYIQKNYELKLLNNLGDF